MDAGKVYFFGVIAIVVAVLAYTFVFTGKRDTYNEELGKFRAEKDGFFKDAPDSPIENRTKFATLSYYPPDQSLRILADIRPIKDTMRLKVGRTDGTSEMFVRYAYADFQLGGKRNRLLLLKSNEQAKEQQLFLAFTDKTNGFETYGGGRYLDLEWEEGKTKITLDFNFAYNPFCAYNSNYSCPLPPTQNHLEIAVRAGEKEFVK